MSDNVFHLIGGLDIGNGYVKGQVVNANSGVSDLIDIPSAVVSFSRPNPKIPIPDEQAPSVTTDDFYNSLDASFSSPLVQLSDRRIFGRKALSIRGSRFVEFEVTGYHSKSEQELSKVLVLGIFAAKTLRDYVAANGHLPDGELVAHVIAALPLPISEFINKQATYGAAFSSGDHLVIVKNFATPVSVRLKFESVTVLPEGASAQFAIASGGVDLATRLISDARAAGQDLEGVEPADLVGVRNTVGVDIGEGTGNFPVFTDGAFNGEASKTLDAGYGSALNSAVERMRDSDCSLSFSSRKQLADFLSTSPSAFQRTRYNLAADFVDDEAKYLVSDICSSLSDVLDQVSSTTEVVYVYGGGSISLREQGFERFVATADPIPVFYVPSDFARQLNCDGLMLAARNAAANRDGFEPSQE